jgi:hypothetical protein
MNQVPAKEFPLVLRTDFSDQVAWEEICRIIRKPVGIFRFRANVCFLDDVDFKEIAKDQLLDLIPRNYNHSFIILVDQVTISEPEHPLLVVDLYERSGRDFRALPSQIQGIENNLSIANMDFEEFAEAVDEDGILRGFPKS